MDKAAFTGSSSIPVSNSNKFAANPQPQSADDNIGYSTDDLNDYIQEYNNPLLRYDNVSWKAKLYALSSYDIRRYQDDQTASVQKYVLAESGVTGKYNIDQIEIVTIPPGCEMTKNSTAMRFSLKISEVGGMRLYDDLQIASSKLGYNQFSDLPMILEMSFVGYDKDSNLPIIIPNCTKKWTVNFFNIQAKFENAGSVMVYNIEMTPCLYMMPANDWRINQQVEVIAGDTVGSFIMEFQTKLNSAWESQYGYLTQLFADRIKPDNFVTFKVHPKIADMRLISDPTQDTSTDRNSTTVGSKKYSLTADFTIGNVVDFILDSALTEHDTTGDLKRQFAHVIPSSSYVGYDIFRKKHVYRYDIYVMPIETIDYQNVNDIRKKNTTEDLISDLSKAHKNKKFNMKRYDFQWSGLNVEVLDLKYDFNSQYVMAVSRNISGTFDKNNRSGEKISQLKVQDQITTGMLYQMYNRKKELESSNSKSTQDQKELSRINNKFAKASDLGIEGEDSQMRAPNYSSDNYIEDFADSSIESLVNERSDNDDLIAPPMDYQNFDSGTSATDDSNATQTDLAKRTIRSNYYNRAFLMSVTIGVVGDPYWLGFSDSDAKDRLQSLCSTGTLNQKSNDVYAMDTMQFEPCFLLNLYPPKKVDFTTGIAQTEENSILAQSVYRVQQIVHKFDRSGFIQTLEGVLVTRSLNRN